MADLEYFYNGSIRRTILHFGRLFMGFQISNGVDENGNEILQRVPCRFASSDRQAMHILRNNSENAILSAPFMSYYINNIDIARDRTRNYTSTDHVALAEREYDIANQRYNRNIGNTMSVERMNPSPINIEFNLDIWTTMIDHKLELIEQIRLIYNPTLTMQISTNPVDWIAMQDVELTGINYSSRSMPIGTDDALDITTLTFKVESWLSAPAKVTRNQLIETIFTNIGEGSSDEDIFGWSLSDISRSVFTPNEHFIFISEDYSTIILLDAYGNPTDRTWQEVFNSYGKYEENTTQIRVRLASDSADPDQDVIGTVSINANDPAVLDWTVDVDTLPGTTLDPVDGVIDPRKSYPGSSLPASITGQRYLLINSIGSEGNSTVAWGDLAAEENDIVEFNGTDWQVVFDSSTNSDPQVVGSIASNKRYQWTETDGWINPVSGKWRSGWWRIAIQT